MLRATLVLLLLCHLALDPLTTAVPFIARSWSEQFLTTGDLFVALAMDGRWISASARVQRARLQRLQHQTCQYWTSQENFFGQPPMCFDATEKWPATLSASGLQWRLMSHPNVHVLSLLLSYHHLSCRPLNCFCNTKMLEWSASERQGWHRYPWSDSYLLLRIGLFTLLTM